MNEADRIAELEIRLSFQDELVSTLNAVVTEQGFKLQQLQRQLDALREVLSTEQAGSGLAAPVNERPPHY